MNLPQPWADWLERWSILTEAESSAIRAEDWARVAEVQGSKTELQAEMSNSSLKPPQSLELKAIIAELCHAEERNSEMIEDIRHRREAERGDLDSARNQLRAVRRTYGHVGPFAAWHSYG